MIPVVVEPFDPLTLMVGLIVAEGRELWMRGGLAAATFFLNGGLIMITLELGAVGMNLLDEVVEIRMALATLADPGSPSSAQEILVQQLERGRREETKGATWRAPTGCRGCDPLTGFTCPT